MSSSRVALAPSKLSCPACDGPVEVKSQHVAIAGTTVRVYCSAECKRLRVKPAPPAPTPVPIVAPRRSRRRWWLLGGAVGFTVIGGAVFAMNDQEPAAAPQPPPPVIQAAAIARPAPPPPAPDPREAEDKALVEEILHDTWIHPLAGPSRRMPINHNGAFGASRPGERPPECVSGHCGVDIGHEWGERVHAVHDGVVDWVNRGPNEERGGIFVKIAHRDGTLFSWYFHLAAVPRKIQPGVKIAAGEVIGLLGDTGVKQSAPHLHFSLSVKTKNHERYLDPEPLIAIWPLWIAGERGGKPSNAVEPGVPVRAPAKRKAKAKAPEAPAEEAPASEPAPEPAPTTTE